MYCQGHIGFNFYQLRCSSPPDIEVLFRSPLTEYPYLEILARILGVNKCMVWT